MIRDLLWILVVIAFSVMAYAEGRIDGRRAANLKTCRESDETSPAVPTASPPNSGGGGHISRGPRIGL